MKINFPIGLVVINSVWLFSHATADSVSNPSASQDLSATVQSPLVPPAVVSPAPVAVNSPVSDATSPAATRVPAAAGTAAPPVAQDSAASVATANSRLAPSSVDARLSFPAQASAPVAVSTVSSVSSGPSQLKVLSDFLEPAGATPTSPTEQPTLESTALAKSATWGVLILGCSALWMLATGRGRA